ncbi:MAG: SOS response-associated peptidase [Deltaproteobacteria bacterium]|jgi:putative SOS response-associated peptidase YedK|nr:SOS response-associated peptidase [Deltaproteobacteria bacterium]
MCGRFVQFSSLRTLESYFQIDSIAADVVASYNIATTQEILAIIHHHGHRLEKLHWGLVPSWAKDLTGASRLINARAETASQKPSFRAAFKRRRCLIVADGFYEWQGEKGCKQPYFIALPSGRPFALAGLWETWKSKEAADGDLVYRSCTILTTAASESVQEIHHRMPVILQPEVYNDWLDPAIRKTDRLEDILKHHHVREMKYYPVSKFVNRVQNNSAECIQPLPDL